MPIPRTSAPSPTASGRTTFWPSRSTDVAGTLGRLGAPTRFSNLAGARSFTGIVPSIDQSGLGQPAQGLDQGRRPGLREALFLASDLARKVDPILAERDCRVVIEDGRRHASAVCTLAAMRGTRIAPCWRPGQHYVLRDVDGSETTEAQGRAVCAERYKVTADVRAARRRTGKAQQLKKEAGRGSNESTKAAPASDPHTVDVIAANRVA